jgi:hypothetical protein
MHASKFGPSIEIDRHINDKQSHRHDVGNHGKLPIVCSRPGIMVR